MKRRDIWLILGVALAAALLLLMGQLTQPQSPVQAVSTLNFSKDSGIAAIDMGAEADSYLRVKMGQGYFPLVPLNAPGEIVLKQDGGKENIIRIDRDSVVMHSANCPGKDCVKMGKMTLMNIEFRVNQRWITCLPHEISLELIPAPEAAPLLEGP